MRSGFMREITGRVIIKVVERHIKTCKTGGGENWKLNTSNQTNKQIQKHHCGEKLPLASSMEQKLSPRTTHEVSWIVPTLLIWEKFPN
jgi:hypothetical protein